MAGLGVLGASVLGALLAGAPQVTRTTPVEKDMTKRPGDIYGPAQPAEIDAITSGRDLYQRTQVITVGQLNFLVANQYWRLRDGSASVLLLPGYGVGSQEMNAFLLSRVEIRGVVRRLRKKEYLPDGTDKDLSEDPTLPVLPAPRNDWPSVSITVLAMADRGDHAPAMPSATGAVTRQIVANPSEYVGKSVHVLGQFRGNNLFGDLPAPSRRENGDWVLKDGETALWITGKAPRGPGWALDPAYKGDTVRWLDVEGKVEVVGGIVYLRASKVLLAAKPKESGAEDP
jgi:hypothetical protein